AGLDDSAFQNRLREVQELLQRALTPELEQRLRELQEALARLDPEATRQALQRLAEAQQQLRRELGRSEELFKRAALEGELASLAQLPDELRQRRDSLTAAWRQETLDALNRALAETAALARRQEDVAAALRDGETGAATRARQAAIEEGTHAIEQEIGAAAGRHALVSPQLEAALGYAQNQMKQAREQPEQGDPNPAAAAPFAEQALDAPNATAH